MLYESFTKKSKRLFEEAKKYLPGGVTYHIRFVEPYPFYVKRAEGSRIWDVDGNEYTDYWMAHGAAILGHGYRLIIDAIKEQLDYGIHFGWCNEWEIEWARAVTDWFGLDKVRPSNSGTEANMYAIRLARAYTGRKKVGKFAGGWHGGYDGLHKSVSYPFDKPASLGLTECVQNDVIILPFNDLEGVYQKVKSEELAAIIVEPVLGAGGAIPADKDFLKGLRELCDERDIVLIFDEVITGFRFYKGATNYYGVKPDIITTGKAVGGQYFPGAGAIVGISEIMDLIDHLKRRNFWERVFHGGTYTGNALTMRAGYLLIKELKERRGEIFPYLDNLGDYFRKMLKEIFEDRNVKALVSGISSMIGIHFTEASSLNPIEITEKSDITLMKKYHKHMLDNKIVYLSPHSPHLFISIAHNREDIDKFGEATSSFLEKIMQ